MGASGDTWKDAYWSNSTAKDDLKDRFLTILELDGVLNYDDIGEDELEQAVEDNLEWLATQYKDELDDEHNIDEISRDDVKDYIKSKEKGVALGPLSRVTTSASVMKSIQDTYEEFLEEDRVSESADLINDFHSEVPGKYDPENNNSYTEDTHLDLLRLQHDIAEGGRAFAYALKYTSETFDELAREEVIPEMIQGIADKDNDGEYTGEIVDKLEIFVENYFERNFESRIVDVEETVEIHDRDIDELIGRVEVLEGQISIFDEITNDINSIYGELDEHSNDIDTVTERVNDLEGRIDEYSGELDDLEDEIHEYVDEKISEIEDQISDNSEGIKSNRSDISSMRSDIEDLQSTVSALDGLEGQVDSLEDRMDSAERRINNNKERLDNYEDRLNTVEDSLNEIEDTLGSHDDRINDLESERSRREERERNLAEIDREAAQRHNEQKDELEEEMNKSIKEIIADLF